MKNKEVLVLWKGLNGLRDDLTGRVFNHAVILNLENITVYVKSLNKAKDPNKEMQKFLDDMELLNERYALKDEKGNPIIKKGIDPSTNLETFFYDIPDNNNPYSEYVKTKENVFKSNKSVIDNHNKMIKEWTEVLLEKESEFTPVLIKLTDIPDAIYKKEMTGIMRMIDG